MKPTSGAGQPLANERGIALVIAILLLMVITLFGALGITMSTRELRGAGDKRFADQRFYEAQATLSHALLRPSDLLTDDFLTAPVTGAPFSPIPIIDVSTAVEMADITIQTIQDEDPDIAAQWNLPVQPHIIEPPAGSGYSMGKFQALRFCVTATTLDGSTDRKSTRLNSSH
mgnify:CR=1 FL=1